MSGFAALVLFAGWCGFLAVGGFLVDWISGFLVDWINRRQG